MSNIQIPNLPAAIGLTGAEQFEAVQAGSSVRVTATAIASFMQSYRSLTFATRALFVAWNASPSTSKTSGMVAEVDGISYLFTNSVNPIPDLPGWIPNNDIFSRHFGAAENYDQATQTGTDDLAAINLALAYAASERKPGVAGGDVWVTWRSLSSGTDRKSVV